MGTFNPEEFMNSTVEDAMSTKIIPCPAGEWLGLIADEVKVKEVIGGPSSKNPGVSFPVLTVIFSIDDPKVTSITERVPTKVRYECFLDIGDNGKLDIKAGRNVGLGRLREAVGLNQSGVPFSFRMLQGKTARVAVTHRTDGDAIYDEVKGVAPAN